MRKILKKLKKILIGVMAFAMITAVSQAVTLVTPTHIPVLKSNVKSNGSWGGYELNSNMSAGDEIVFQIHAYANGGNIINLKSYLDNINNSVFSQGQTKTIGAKVSADNASTQSGSVRVTANDNVKLVYKKYKWGKTLWNGQTPVSTTIHQLPNGQSGTATMSSGGVRLGNLEKNNNSNLLIYFTVESASTNNNKKPEITTLDAKNITDSCATLRSTVDLNGNSSTKVHFEYGVTSNNLSISTSSETVYNNGSYEKRVCGLDQNRTYYFRAYLNTGQDGGLKNFRTEREVVNTKQEEVTTRSAISITDSCATFRGSIVLNDEDNAYLRFRYGTNSSQLNQIVNYGYVTLDGNIYEKRVCGLDQNRTYYFQAYTANDEGSILNFRTNNGSNNNVEADVTTLSATSISDECATLRADIDLNDDSSTQVRFRYGTSSSNLSEYTSYTTRNSDGTYSERVCGLDEDEKYYFQAYLDNGDEGGVRNFTTDDNGGGSSSDDEEEVTTKSATSISDNCATFRAYVDLNDEDDTYLKFRYGTDDDDLDDTVSYGRVSSNGNYSERVCGLDEDEKYYFQAYTTNDRGSTLNFRTDDDDDDDDDNNDEDAEVTTRSATNIYSYTAQLNGSVDVNDTDDPRVYFEYGTSSSNLNKTTSKVRVSRNTYFQSIVGLSPNTRYYFRAVVTDDDGDIIDRGNILSFVSARETTPTSGTTDAMTTGAYAGTYAADLYGQIVGGDERVICYFEYGRTTSLGSKTAYVTKNANTTKACSAKITGLKSGTRYYYRAVVIDDGVTYRGTTRSLTTKTVYTTPVSTRPVTNNVTVNENVTVTVEEVVESEGINLQINKWVSKDQRDGYGLEVNAEVGDTVYYKVRVKNNTNDDIEDVTVTDHIPYELELSDSREIEDDVDKYLTWKIGRMRPGEVRTFVTEMTVSSKAQYGDVISSRAEISKDGIVEETNSVDIYVRGNNQGASIFGANSSFFPTSLIGWLGLLALLLFIAFLISRIFATKRENDIKLAAFREAQREKYRNR